MSSASIACLLYKLQIEGGKVLLFYNYLKKKYSGGYTLPSYQSVNKSKNKMLWNHGEDAEVFSEKFDRLWESYTSSNKEKSSRLPVAPNNVYVLS
jgi:hypothetical protein